MRPQKDEYGRPFRPYRLGLQSNRSTPGGWEVDGCIGVVLKIETLKGFENLPELMLAALAGDCAGVMIACGDLAVECGYERLAEVQEETLWCAKAAHISAIWATQVLETLAKTGVPSCAEISDAGLGAARPGSALKLPGGLSGCEIFAPNWCKLMKPARVVLFISKYFGNSPKLPSKSAVKKHTSTKKSKWRGQKPKQNAIAYH